MIRNSQKTPVSELQEYMTKHCRILPNYELVYSGCGSAKVWFKFQLRIENFTVFGEGPSKQEAKHSTARAMLVKLGVRKNVEPNDLHDLTDKVKSTNINQSSFFNSMGALNELCVRFNLPAVEYSVVKEEGPPHNKEFTLKCTVGNQSELSSASTKQDAKHHCALKMLEKLENQMNALRQKCELDPKQVESSDLPHLAERVKSTSIHPPSSFNAVGALTEFCARSHLPAAQYFVVKEEGLPHLKEFTLKCTVGQNSEVSCARSKQEAKRQCAAKMLSKLKNLAGNQMDAFSLEEDPSPKLSREEIKVIIKKFKASSMLLSQNNHSNNFTQLPFKDYHNAAKLGPKVSSAVMDDLSNIVRRKDFDSLETQPEGEYSDLLEKLLRDLNLTHDFIVIPPHKKGCAIIALNINYVIPLSFLGIGTGILDAKRKATIDAVNWFAHLYN